MQGWFQSCPLLDGSLADARQVTRLLNKHKPLQAATRSHKTYSGKQKRGRLHRRQSSVQTQVCGNFIAVRLLFPAVRSPLLPTFMIHLLVQAAGTQAVTLWRARSPLEALHLLHAQLRLPVQLPPCPLWGRPYGRTLSQLPSLKQGLEVLSGALDFLSQPPVNNPATSVHTATDMTMAHEAGWLRHCTTMRTANMAAKPRFLQGGYPVCALDGVPGWQPRLVRGPRRWLGLRPGRRLTVPGAGPWWTPSGATLETRLRCIALCPSPG